MSPRSQTSDESLLAWPPPGSVAVDLTEFYPELAARGFGYGPAFHGLAEAWRLDEQIYGRVVLPEALTETTGDYGIHPVLLDAALHPIVAGLVAAVGSEQVLLPFAWSDVTLHATGATELRVRLRRAASSSEDDVSASLVLADPLGQPVATVGELRLRRTTAEQVRTAARSESHYLYRVDWLPVVLPEVPAGATGRVLGGDGRLGEVLDLETAADLQALLAELDTGAKAPERLVIDATTPRWADTALPEAVHTATEQALVELQTLLAEPRLGSTAMVWVTRSAIGTGPDDSQLDLAHAPVWGLVRGARNEHPERVLRLVDIDIDVLPADSGWQMLCADREPELAWRHRIALAARLLSAESDRSTLSAPPEASAWRLEVPTRGSLDNLCTVPLGGQGGNDTGDAAEAAPELGQVRVAVRAAGMNFRDVLNALGMVPIPWLGLELAGVVIAVGEGVDSLAVGDRVLGLGQATFATVATTDARLLTPIPAGLSFVEAATIPVNFLTALYALRDLADLKAGERVLIHAAAGGVGMAAVQLARHWDVEVFATASPDKWPDLRATGLDPTHIANSRDTHFATSFLTATGGAGVDVVLNALAGDFVDASLRLLPRGGRFLEMGKTDLRDAEAVSAEHPGVVYHAFELFEAGPEHIQRLLGDLASLFEQGALSPLPLAAYELRHAPVAFKHMANARHVGKLVLQPPRSLERDGTVLLTGGLGELGQTVARHLVSAHGVRHLVLTSRRGSDAPGAQEVVATLESLGAQSVRLAACDVANREELASVLAAIPASRPLTGILHLAGVIDDGMVSALTAERLARVLRPKVDGAWNLHRLTQEQDLAVFVMFSSAVGVMGGLGQSNYAAANTFLDALAVQRRKLGLPAISLAWGLWQQQGLGMTAHLGKAELTRMRRQGLAPMSVETGLALLDAALARPEATLVPARLDLVRIERQATVAAALPGLLRALLRPNLRRASAAAISASGLRQRLAPLPEQQRLGTLVKLVREDVAAVMGLAGAQAVPADQPLKALGLDSLMAVELRNQLSTRAETTLPTTLAFDYPTPEAIAGLLLRQAFAELSTEVVVATPGPRLALDEPIAVIAMACRVPGGVLDPDGYWTLLDQGRDAIGPFPERWNIEALYDPDPDARGKSYAREGGFLQDVDHFDPGFFGISSREALEMDPQQRLVLEVAWEALEQAGLCPATLNESNTGVYLGSMGSDYGLGDVSLEALDGYRTTGQASSVLSGRLAYVLGLQGPAMTVDTACSSSLVALHLACTGLRQDECDLALAGGVQVMSTPATFVEFSRLRGMAPDGRCKAFSAAADGAGWSEGCGVLVLKRLSDAQRDGDRVLAVMRGSAVNQDGRSQGLTAPNGPSQQRVIRRALSKSDLTPDDIDALEAHGTGTDLGTPIEAGALAEVFGPTRSEERPLWLGSSKSNLGHTQAAAGVLGVMKMVLALMHERLPKTLHAERAERAHHVARQRAGAGTKGSTLAAPGRASATGGRIEFRHQRHQRPRGAGGGAPTGSTDGFGGSSGGGAVANHY